MDGDNESMAHVIPPSLDDLDQLTRTHVSRSRSRGFSQRETAHVPRMIANGENFPDDADELLSLPVRLPSPRSGTSTRLFQSVREFALPAGRRFEEDHLSLALDRRLSRKREPAQSREDLQETQAAW